MWSRKHAICARKLLCVLNIFLLWKQFLFLKKVLTCYRCIILPSVCMESDRRQRLERNKESEIRKCSFQVKFAPINQRVMLNSVGATVRNVQKKSGLRWSDLWDLRQPDARVIAWRGGATPQWVGPSQQETGGKMS